MTTNPTEIARRCALTALTELRDIDPTSIEDAAETRLTGAEMDDVRAAIDTAVTLMENALDRLTEAAALDRLGDGR